ncbi:MAG: type II toxin-antitoxin system Phd/YefM family antitoxin [Beijerinckiaceae bacterium]
MGHHSITEAVSRLSELIDLARQGEPVVIVRAGEKVAEIKPRREVPGPLSDEKLKWLEEAIIQPSRQSATTVEIVRALRDEWDR